MSTLLILWDASYIWGILAVKAAKSMQVMHEPVLGKGMAARLQHRPPAMLLVPGGNARGKASSLGSQGKAAVQEYVAQGGKYLGFCGGAGLALSWQGALGLCPCTRGAYDDRLQHFMSGHMHVTLDVSAEKKEYYPAVSGHDRQLPVWWPGRFDTDLGEGVSVLASYTRPGEDFWLADLPIATLPPETFSVWRDVYGFSVSPAFLHGQACIVQGGYGKGEYVLSYSHLETPQSSFANAWLAHLLEHIGGIHCPVQELPEWDIAATEQMWDDATLLAIVQMVDDLLSLGVQHNLLFERTPWLLGWRTGIPGANLNNLRTALYYIISIAPSTAASSFWQQHKKQMIQAASFFHQGCVQYLLAERLAMTLAKKIPDVLPYEMLQQQRESLFGKPMHASGCYHELMEVMNHLAFLQAKHDATSVA